MSSYNVYSNMAVEVGDSIPVWLGVVSPKPVGCKLNASFAVAGAFYPAGSPIQVKNGIATPFGGYSVVSATAADTNTVINVIPFGSAGAPTTSSMLMKVGANFAATGKAWNPDAVALQENGSYNITVATAGIDAVSAGDVIAESSATSEGSGKSLAVKPNCYLYNDVAIDPAIAGANGSICASCAVVDFHGEGLLINRTPASFVAGQMKVAVPNVIVDERF